MPSAVPERAERTLARVVAEVIGTVADAEACEPGRSWDAHTRLRGPSGRVCELLTSAEWQEARFHEPRASVFILTDGTPAQAEEALTRLARAVREYLAGQYELRIQRRLFRSERVIELRTVDGEWIIGRRVARVPQP